MGEHKTRDIYLAAYCVLNGCELKIKKAISGESPATFILSFDAEKLKDLIDAYFGGRAQCDPKDLKFKITDIKNQLYSIIDNG